MRSMPLFFANSTMAICGSPPACAVLALATPSFSTSAWHSASFAAASGSPWSTWKSVSSAPKRLQTSAATRNAAWDGSEKSTGQQTCFHSIKDIHFLRVRHEPPRAARWTAKRASITDPRARVRGFGPRGASRCRPPGVAVWAMQGRLELLSLRAPSLEGNPLGDPAERPLYLYLPPGHDQARGRFPAVYFLHGFFGTAHGWTAPSPFQPTVPERLDALIAAGAIPPLVAVFPDGFTRLGGSQWANSSASGCYRDYLARDVVAAVDARARTLPAPEGRALVGKSSGGYGALPGGRHPPEGF